MVSISMNELLNSVPIFRIISETPMNIKSAYKIAKIMREVDKEQQLFLEAQQMLINKYSKDKDKNTINEQFVETYNQEMKVFLENIINLDVEKIDLEDIMNVELTPAQVYLIDNFIEKK